MKRIYLLLSCVTALAVVSCNDGTETTTTTTSTSDSSAAGTADTSGTTTNTYGTSALPLNREDSLFVMEAAAGSLMEIEAGNLAQQNGQHQRVKDFAAMMVRDHTQASNELKSLAASRNMMLPDTLPKKHKDHMEAMRKMTGSAFDKHYMNMMNTAHTEDINKFEKASTGAQDTDLKAWAGKTLPVLKMHKDSAAAINKLKL